MKLRIYGTRGSMPHAREDMLEYGGNSSSYVLDLEDMLVFLDGGTGIVRACKDEEIHWGQKPDKDLALVLSHGHGDHVYGLAFAPLAYLPVNVPILGPQAAINGLRGFYSEDVMPISCGVEMPALDLDQATLLYGGESFLMGKNTVVHTLAAHHPRRKHDGSMLYRFDQGAGSMVYATDFEIDYLSPSEKNDRAEQFKDEFVNFIDGAEVLLCDGQYVHDEYDKKKGFGHPYLEQIIPLAEEANVKQLVFTHHDLHRSDKDLDELTKEYSNAPVPVRFAREGEEYSL